MNMRIILSIVFFLLIGSIANGQNINADWYSETVNNGLTIQNSYPKGGPYTGPTTEYFNYSYLVFFTRVVNGAGSLVELTVHFSADSIAIPNSPNTYVKLFLPPDMMTLEKRSLFSYGVTELESFDQSTRFQRKLNPEEDCLFYVVAVFYQTKAEAWRQERGGNRAELVVKGQELFYNMPPQVNSIPCGHISFNK